MSNKTKIVAAMLSLSCTAMASMESIGAIKAYDPFIAQNVEGNPVAIARHVHDQYAAAPATVYHDGLFHQFYCSTGTYTDMHFYDFSSERSDALYHSWDHIRYRYSKNGTEWSSPFIVITQSPGEKKETCTCDPAIIYNEKDGYWYLFYQGAIDNYGNAVYVSRSKGLRGPFEKFSKNGSTVKWDRWTTNPTPLIKKTTNDIANSPDAYGVGQVSVVYREGKFHFWINEMMNGTFFYTINGSKALYTKKYHITVDNITDLVDIDLNKKPMDSRVNALIHTETDSAYYVDKNGNSQVHPLTASYNKDKWHFSDFGEVRWNADANRYEMWIPDKNLGYDMHIIKYYSTNGIEWRKDRDYNKLHENRHMAWIHNIGVSGDKFGHIHEDRYLLSFSGPHFYESFTDSMLREDYSMEFGEVVTGLWPMWELLNGSDWQTINVNYGTKNYFGESPSKQLQFFVGDFDGDGIDELGAVEKLYNGMLRWYLQSSKNPSNNRKSDTWNSRWSSIAVGGSTDNQYKILSGDYDGDGKTDYGVVVYRKDNEWKSYWRIHSSRKPSPPKGLGQEWKAVSPDYALPTGDYDGDGVVDKVAFLPSANTWHMVSSIDSLPIKMRRITGTDETCNDGPWEHNTLPIIHESELNVSNFTPVAADYDGDHITDLALLDQSGNLYIRSSQTGCHLKWNYTNPSGTRTRLTHWPYRLSNNKPLSGMYLAADFDGDGVADHMILNKSSGSSEIHFSRGGLHIDKTLSFPILKNLTSKEVLVGDFDGNGLSDICIIDLATNNYYIYFFNFNDATEKVTTTTAVNKVVKYVDFSSSYPLAKKSVKSAEPAEPEIVQEKAMPNFSAHVQDQKLVVSNTLAGQKVAVFDMRGKEISRKVSSGLDMTFDIPSKGVYIVRSGNSTRKISIK